MKKVILSIAVIVAIGLTSCKNETKKDTEAVTPTEEVKYMAINDTYKCPMDCEKGKTYDKAGSCPVCKMDLQKVKKDDDDARHDD